MKSFVKANKYVVGTFFLLEIILYLLIVFIDSNLPTNVISYVSIILCLGYGIYILFIKKDILSILMVSGLFFTAISDLFLVYLNPMLNIINQSIAMTTFSLTQISYAIILIISCKCRKELIANIITRVCLFIVLEIVAIIILKENYNYLILISLFYFANLVTNIIFAFIQKDNNLLFALGLLLFIGCDLVIGLQELCTIMSIPETSPLYKIVFTSLNVSWLFYLPSQVMLTTSIPIHNPKNINSMFNKINFGS